jgi:hypothetical protein
MSLRTNSMKGLNAIHVDRGRFASTSARGVYSRPCGGVSPESRRSPMHSAPSQRRIAVTSSSLPMLSAFPWTSSNSGGAECSTNAGRSVLSTV